VMYDKVWHGEGVKIGQK